LIALRARLRPQLEIRLDYLRVNRLNRQIIQSGIGMCKSEYLPVLIGYITATNQATKVI
jgi:hypothetical protein